MNAIRTLLATAAIATAASATAATISYGGIAATGGGYTTALTGVGVTTETFNGTTGNCGPTTGVAITGNYQIVTGSQTGFYAAPAGDTTCYLSIPQTGGSGQAQLTVAPLVAGKKYNYLGLYWGSIDDYNSIAFYNDNTLVTTITGMQVLAANGIPGDQSASGSNRYVNIYFSPNEVFNKVTFISNGVAFEVDNVAFKQAPEPGALALFGAGLLGTALVRRRRKAA